MTALARHREAVADRPVAKPERVRRQVFVCGDLHNLGDLQLLLQNLALTGGRGGVVRRWAPLPPAVVRRVEAAGGVLVSGRSLLGFARAAFGARLVLGGGQLVRDNVALAALLGLLLTVWSARLGGGRFETRGLGVSLIRSPLRACLWRAILSCCDTVHLRDAASARQFAQLLPGRAYVVDADMAFLPVPGSHAITPGRGARRWIVIAPCVDPGEGRSLEGAGLDAALAAALGALPEARVVIACHDPRAAMDRAAAARLVARWPDHAVEVRDGYDLDALIALYREAALVLTNRLHALIFAILADAPVVAIADGTAKVHGLAERLAVPVLPQHGAAEAEACVVAALGFDRALRAQRRQDLALAAAGNLESGALVGASAGSA